MNTGVCDGAGAGAQWLPSDKTRHTNVKIVSRLHSKANLHQNGQTNSETTFNGSYRKEPAGKANCRGILFEAGGNLPPNPGYVECEPFALIIGFGSPQARHHSAGRPRDIKYQFVGRKTSFKA